MGDKYDFSGYATRADLKCSDGRIIRKDAFRHNDGAIVPLVWQHFHNDPGMVLGHAVLENRPDGMYAYGKFNDTDAGKNAKMLVEHGDIRALSIHANQLKQQGPNVLHGQIREVSLVMSGANPGAFIENVSIQHSDGSFDMDETEAVIYTGEEFTIMARNDDLQHGEGKEKTVQDVFNSFTEEQKQVVYFMVGAALEEKGMKHSDDDDDDYDDDYDDDDDDDYDDYDKEDDENMKHNIFDTEEGAKNTLSHADFQMIVEDAKKIGSLKEAFALHAEQGLFHDSGNPAETGAGYDYGIRDIDILFPDARLVTPTPTFISREMGWVAGVMAGTHHTPFSRIKSTASDITAEEARARGYVKGNLKKEEVIKLLQRVTTPKTIYKKQKLDRDDIVDITDMDVVRWLKAEMRVMLDEEIARAILVGDGRDPEDEDKIDEQHIRPIYKDDDMYAHHVLVEGAEEGKLKTTEIIEAIIRARKFYKGKGTPTFYTTTDILTDMLLLKDKLGRKLYATEAEIASTLRVAKIVEVEVMEGLSREDETGTSLDLIGLIVNLKDYNVGADKGGEVNMFDDFDIDYNQYKYLIETRISGALINPKTALVIEKLTSDDIDNGDDSNPL